MPRKYTMTAETTALVKDRGEEFQAYGDEDTFTYVGAEGDTRTYTKRQLIGMSYFMVPLEMNVENL